MLNDALVKTIIIAAPKEAVWAYLIDKDKLGTWFNPAREDLALGEEYVMYVNGKKDGATCIGKVLEVDMPNKLRMTFSISPMIDFDTTLEWTLTEVEGGTKLTLIHEGMSKGGLGLYSAIDAGWDKHFGKLREQAAG